MRWLTKVSGTIPWNNRAMIISYPVNFLMENRRREIRLGKVYTSAFLLSVGRWEGRWFTLQKQPSVIYRNPLHGQRRYRIPVIDRNAIRARFRQISPICVSYPRCSFLFTFPLTARRTRPYLVQRQRAVFTAVAADESRIPHSRKSERRIEDRDAFVILQPGKFTTANA